MPGCTAAHLVDHRLISRYYQFHWKKNLHYSNKRLHQENVSVIFTNKTPRPPITTANSISSLSANGPTINIRRRIQHWLCRSSLLLFGYFRWAVDFYWWLVSRGWDMFSKIRMGAEQKKFSKMCTMQAARTPDHCQW